MGSDGTVKPRQGWWSASAAVSSSCHYCNSAPALRVCRQDSPFICMACDAEVHEKPVVATAQLKHDRVWMCQVCELAPAAVTCKADAAMLCVVCDSSIHSANPIASRHERFPLFPFYDKAESAPAVKSAAASSLPAVPIGDFFTDSWNSEFPINGTKVPEPDNTQDVKSMEFLFSDSDQFLDFSGRQIPPQTHCDRAVPVQAAVKLSDHTPENQFEIDFKKPNIKFSYKSSHNTSSLRHSISSSSHEVGIVPDGSTLFEPSYPFSRCSNPGTNLNGIQGTELAGMDREARVLRYREKKKNRKFEKTIRYASRKAYAETRPRIKGRFVKRSDHGSIEDRFPSVDEADFTCGAVFGVVPIFYA